MLPKPSVRLTDIKVHQQAGVSVQERLLIGTGKQPETSVWADLHEMEISTISPLNSDEVLELLHGNSGATEKRGSKMSPQMDVQ